MTSALVIADVATRSWNQRAVALANGVIPTCQGVVVDERGLGCWRLAYLSLASSEDIDLRVTQSLDGDVFNGYDALIDGFVLAVVWRGERMPQSAIPTKAFATAQQNARRAVLTARHGINALALEEMANPTGASQRSVHALADLWCSSAALTLDVAFEICLGADRQRYVDRSYGARFRQRAQSLLERLTSHGIYSHPLLTLS